MSTLADDKAHLPGLGQAGSGGRSLRDHSTSSDVSRVGPANRAHPAVGTGKRRLRFRQFPLLDVRDATPGGYEVAGDADARSSATTKCVNGSSHDDLAV